MRLIGLGLVACLMAGMPANAASVSESDADWEVDVIDAFVAAEDDGLRDWGGPGWHHRNWHRDHRHHGRHHRRGGSRPIWRAWDSALQPWRPVMMRVTLEDGREIPAMFFFPVRRDGPGHGHGGGAGAGSGGGGTGGGSDDLATMPLPAPFGFLVAALAGLALLRRRQSGA